MATMHADELQIGEALVRRLLTGQFPEWADLPLQEIEAHGTENAIFRLGDRLSVRLARRKGPTTPGGKEFDWLPRLARLLPVETPIPVAQGRPTGEYPWFWDIYTWVRGDTVPVEQIDVVRAARDLASLVGALQQLSPADAPKGRGIPLGERDDEVRHWLASFDDVQAVAAAWERALEARRGMAHPSGTTAISM